MTIKQWLHLHRRTLKSYKADEIVRLATACGFDFKEVCYELLSWFNDLAQEGCQTDLYEQWAYLHMLEQEGWDWSEQEAA